MTDEMNDNGQSKQSSTPILLLEYSFTVSRVILILVTALTAVFSFFAGCSWISVVVRAGSVALVLGLLLYGLNLLVVEGTMDVIFRQVASLKKKEDHASTQEWKV